MLKFKRSTKTKYNPKPYSFLGNCSYDGNFNFEYQKLDIIDFFPEKKHIPIIESAQYTFDFIVNDLGFLHLPYRHRINIYDGKFSGQLDIQGSVKSVKNFENIYLIYENRVIEISKVENSSDDCGNENIDNKLKTRESSVMGLIDMNYTIAGETCLLFQNKMVFVGSPEKYLFDNYAIQFHPTLHPREFFVIMKNDTYFVDLRAPDPIHLIYSKFYNIDSKIDNSGKIFVLDRQTLNFFDRRNMARQCILHNMQSPRLSLNSKECILHTSNCEFLFVNKDNLYHNKNIIFDIPDFTAFTTRDDEYHFLDATGIHTFKNGTRKFLKCKESQFELEKIDIDLKYLDHAYNCYKRRIKRRDEEEIRIPLYLNKIKCMESKKLPERRKKK
ncbi:hypothetical protein DMUE_1306 [Dictyocoela muelleri]|nr:hypothetical protein DMUE_1306 [Dictyocoela muelleri]